MDTSKQGTSMQSVPESQKLSDPLLIELPKLWQNSKQRFGLAGEEDSIFSLMPIYALNSEAVVEQKRFSLPFINKQAAEKTV